MTNREILIASLQKYAGEIVRNSFYWNTLSSHVYISDISKDKVRIDFCFTLSKDKYLRSFRRIAMGALKRYLKEELTFKKSYIDSVWFGDVRTTTYNSEYKHEKIDYCDMYIKYIIPKDLYTSLEALARLDENMI